MAEITPEQLTAVLERREERAVEVESGLRFLREMLRGIKAQVRPDPKPH